MQSTDIRSTRFALAPGVSPSTVIDAINRLLPEAWSGGVQLHVDVPDFEHQRERYSLQVRLTPADPALVAVVHQIVDAIGPALAQPMELWWHELAFYAGPSRSAVQVFKDRCQVERALESLGDGPLASAARDQLQRILTGTPIHAVAEISGGVIQCVSVLGQMPVELLTLNYDIEDCNVTNPLSLDGNPLNQGEVQHPPVERNDAMVQKVFDFSRSTAQHEVTRERS